MQQDSVNIRYI